MNRRTLVLSILGSAIAAFAIAGYVYQEQDAARQTKIAAEQSDNLVRPHAPVIGPSDAPVTIVEFFDLSCETCRAFHPFVKKILSDHPKDVRLVIRYAPFHEGSDEAVRILEAAAAGQVRSRARSNARGAAQMGDSRSAAELGDCVERR